MPGYNLIVTKPDMPERKVSEMSNARYFALVAAAIIAASGTPGTGSAMVQKGAAPAPGAPEIHAAAAAEVSTAATVVQSDDDEDIPPADL